MSFFFLAHPVHTYYCTTITYVSLTNFIFLHIELYYIVCGIVECISIKLDRRLVKFVYSMLNSRNLTVYVIRLFLQSDSSTFAENVRYLMYKYEIPIFVWERDFSDVIKYVYNKQIISPIQLSEVDGVKELCKKV